MTESPSPRWREDGREVEAEGGGGCCTGGGDGDCAGGISGEAVHSVLEGFGEGVECKGPSVALNLADSGRS